jgi:hypothetical protein
MLGFDRLAADTDEEAALLFTSLQQVIRQPQARPADSRRRRRPATGSAQPPAERAMIAQAPSSSAVGFAPDGATWHQGLPRSHQRG